MVTDNNESIKNKWNDAKLKIKEIWSNLTEDELEKTNGDFNSVTDLIYNKYGTSQLTREEISQKLSFMHPSYLEEEKNWDKDEEDTFSMPSDSFDKEKERK